MYGRHEGMGASVIAHGNSALVLESAEHDFDFVALFIEFFVIGHRFFSVSPGGDAGNNPFFKQLFPEPGGIVSPVRQKFIGLRHGIEQYRRALVITGLALGKMKSHRLAGGITDSVEL